MNKNHDDKAAKTAPQAQRSDRNGGSGYGSAQRKPADTTAQNLPKSAPAQAGKPGERLGAQPQKRS